MSKNDNAAAPTARRRSLIRAFVESAASGGIALMFAAALALVVANSPWAQPTSVA